jgi:hypothetical protein
MYNIKKQDSNQIIVSKIKIQNELTELYFHSV